MHFLDLFWGAQEHHKIDPNSSRFCWNVTRCVINVLFQKCEEWTSGFSQVCQNFEVPRKDVFSVRHAPNRKNIFTPDASRCFFREESTFNHSCEKTNEHYSILLAANAWDMSFCPKLLGIYIYYNTYIYIICTCKPLIDTNCYPDS